MSPALPDGEPVPQDGSLPAWVRDAPADRPEAEPFGVYLHVPYCTVRCGYCDFNTYTAAELGGGASQATYAQNAVREIGLAGEVLADADRGDRPVTTVFVGGGTPTVLPVADLALMLDAVRSTWGLA
ncbi:MAG: coproporphyrinogen III oxidase, partial [Cellulomonadaceae bacterium]|nr:coproporphyrinogen III oxidase [Cellulomonadaceae bacterium]